MSKKRRFVSQLVLGLALLADLFVHGVPSVAHAPSQASLAAAMAAQAQVTEDWLALDGVVGTAVGLGAPGEVVVKVYVTELGAAMLPQSVAGVPVRVELTGRFVSLVEASSVEASSVEASSVEASSVEVRETGSLSAPASRNPDSGEVDPKAGFPRPVPIGVSTGHPDVTAGTIGARVTDGTEVYALSNNHVFAANNRGRSGDNLLQPGIADGGRNPDDVVATLFDFEPIQFCAGFACPSNRIDAAIALSTPDDIGTETPEGGYGQPRSDPFEGTLGMSVQKYGRTTGHTVGRVTGINATIDVNYRTGVARFVGQIVITGSEGEFSAGGDSGSLIVTKGLLLADRRPVGLLFAGSTGTTIANPIELVLDRFGVRVDGG